MRFGETAYEFLNRSGSTYFSTVRDLVEHWLNSVDPKARAPLEGALRGEDHSFYSAFWELYLHEAYKSSGYNLEIHPELKGTRNRPDFKVDGETGAFYLEAVKVGMPPEKIGEDRRLEAVHRVLSDMKISTFRIGLTTYTIGPRPLATKPLRRELKRWLVSLDPDQVTAEAALPGRTGFDRLPQLRWENDGWSLEFHAVPLIPEKRKKEGGALAMMGPGEAVIVDNKSGILRVLQAKSSRYGELDLPLVVAVLSNTTYPTKDYEIEQALYGVSSYRPADSPAHLERLFEEGFWLTKQGWVRSRTPQVVSAAGLSPWFVVKVVPRVWQTLQPEVAIPIQPNWLARLDLATEAVPLESEPMNEVFGLPSDWPGAEPDFSTD